jgi:hypothetical protein
MLRAGWGVFNLVEGLFDHQLLGFHHVCDDFGAPLAWDLGLLALGVGLVAAGLALSRTRDRGTADAQRDRPPETSLILGPSPARKVRTGRTDPGPRPPQERDDSAAAELEAGSAPRRGASCWRPCPAPRDLAAHESGQR